MTTTPIPELLFQPSDATPVSSDSATLKPWSLATARLETAPKVWLQTVRPDGRPHAMPVLFVWADGVGYVASRPGTRKSRNIEANPHATVTVAAEDVDLVLETTSSRVRSSSELDRVASLFEAKYGWVFSVRDGSSYDDSLPGSPEYGFYRFTPTRAYGYGPDGLTATRWRFA